MIIFHANFVDFNNVVGSDSDAYSGKKCVRSERNYYSSF